MKPNPSSLPPARSFREQVPALLLLTGIFYLNFLARLMPAPFLPSLERDLKLSHTQAGSLFLFVSSGYCIALLCSGLLSSRVQHRTAIAVSASLAGIALAAQSTAGSFLALSAALFGLGLGAGLYLPSGIATLTSLVPKRHWGKALAIHELAPNLAFVSAPLLAEGFLPFGGWRRAFPALSLALLLLAAVWIRWGQGGAFSGRPPAWSATRTLLSSPAFWAMTVFFIMGIGASLAVYSMLPLYLTTERGMASHTVNTVVALSRVSGMGMAFLAGWATDRLGPRRTIGLVLATTGALTLLLAVLPQPWILVGVFLHPAVAVCFFPAAFAALSAISPAEERNLAVSLVIPPAYLAGGGAVPAAIGAVGESASFALGIALFGGAILLSLPLLHYLGPLTREPP